jgi:hypothetical protein
MVSYHTKYDNQIEFKLAMNGLSQNYFIWLILKAFEDNVIEQLKFDFETWYFMDPDEYYETCHLFHWFYGFYNPRFN